MGRLWIAVSGGAQEHGTAVWIRCRETPSGRTAAEAATQKEEELLASIQITSSRVGFSMYSLSDGRFFLVKGMFFFLPNQGAQCRGYDA